MNPARDPEVLLTYDGFVRALAAGLVSDGHRADDVAQETWMAALEHAPRDRRSLRAWLAALVRNFASKLEGSERARVQREQTVSREEAVPSTHEILEREAVRRSVVQAVVELEEPYRSVVLLRYFEHLPPREIARRLSVPVATVHTRTKRALEQLRTKLDQEQHGERCAWTAVLTSLAQLPPPLPVVAGTAAPITLLTGGSPLLGVIAMSIQSKIAIAVALLACSSVVLWRFATAPAPEVPPSSAQLEDASAASAASATRAATQDLARRTAEPAPAPRREVASAPAPETRAAEATGSLFVRLLWASDKTPAARVAARVTPSWRVTPVFDQIYAESGDDGTFRIPAIRTGAATVQVLRGGSKKVEVETGKEAQVTVEIPGGFAVTGTVVHPGGQPAAGAEIWLALSTSLAAVVAHSAADGSFRLRNVANHSHIGAVDPGRGRSPLLQLFDRKGSAARDEVQVRLTLRDAVGELAGRVLDPSGTPVAGALAVLGKYRNVTTKEGGELAMWKDGVIGVAYPVMEAKTDSEGRFHFRAVTPGRDQVVIRAKTFAAWTGTVEVSAGSCATLEARLVPGATLTGTVTDSAGKSVEGCEVTAGEDTWRTDDPAWVLASSVVRSDAQGAFRFEALTPGRIEVKAQTADRGSAKTVLTAADGTELRWDAVLSGGLELRGRVVDHLGAPLPNWVVHIGSEAPSSPPTFGSARTDQEGRFRITNLEDLPHRVEFLGDGRFLLDARSGVRPGGAEVTFRIAAEQRATASVTGVVVDADDRPLGDVTVWLYRSDAVPGERGRDDAETEPTGRFRFRAVPPGRYRLLYVQGKGIYPTHRTLPTFFAGERKLGSGETWDLGTLRVVPGGTLRVTAKGEAGLEIAKAWVALSTGNQYLDSVRFEDGGAHWIGAGGAGDRVLASGSYQLQVWGDGFARASHTFEIRSGSETHLDLVLRRGIPKTFVIENTAPEPMRRLVHLTVHDSEGKLVLDYPSMGFSPGSPSAKHSAWLLPGTYRARATMDSCAGAVEFRVAAEAAGNETVRIVLK